MRLFICEVICYLNIILLHLIRDVLLENKMDKFDDYVKTLPISDEELNDKVKQALSDDGEDFIPECDFELNEEFETSLKDELSDF